MAQHAEITELQRLRDELKVEREARAAAELELARLRGAKQQPESPIRTQPAFAGDAGGLSEDLGGEAARRQSQSQLSREGAAAVAKPEGDADVMGLLAVKQPMPAERSSAPLGPLGPPPLPPPRLQRKQALQKPASLTTSPARPCACFSSLLPHWLILLLTPLSVRRERAALWVQRHARGMLARNRSRRYGLKRGRSRQARAASGSQISHREQLARARRIKVARASGEHAALVERTSGVLAKLALLSHGPLSASAVQVWQDRQVDAQREGLRYRKLRIGKRPHSQGVLLRWLSIEYVHRLQGAAFCVKATERGYIFGCESEEEAERWVRAISALACCERKPERDLATTRALLSRELNQLARDARKGDSSPGMKQRRASPQTQEMRDEMRARFSRAPASPGGTRAEQREQASRARRIQIARAAGEHAALGASTSGVLAKLALLSHVQVGGLGVEVWQDRHVAAQPDGLLYRKLRFGQLPHGYGILISWVSIDYVHLIEPAAFCIKAKERGYIFKCESVEDAKRWVYAISTLAVCECKEPQDFEVVCTALRKEFRQALRLQPT